MMAMAVLTKALAVRCNLYLPRAEVMKVKRTEAVENKKAATEAWMRAVAGRFPLVAGPMMQVTVVYGRMSEKNSSNSTGTAFSPKAQPVADLSLPDYP